MLEGIRCRIKFYFLLMLFFAPVGMGEWRSQIIAQTDAPCFTEPIPELRDYCLRSEQEDAAVATVEPVGDDDDLPGE